MSRETEVGKLPKERASKCKSLIGGEIMKLTYRGVSYDYTPNLILKDTPCFDAGVYRGQPIHFQVLAETPEQLAADLTWRGIPYHTGKTTEAAPSVTAPKATPEATSVKEAAVRVQTNGSVMDKARQLFIWHHQHSRKREQGMMVRLAAEVGISVDDAAHYESHIQGKLPHDFDSYDRNSAAMS
jgi:hypothetical protein